MNSSKKVENWDALVRFIHWSLVAALIGAYLTGSESNAVHLLSGFAALLLVLGRVVWGFFGSGNALFSSFLVSGEELSRYLKSLSKGQPRRYPGNSPLTGWLSVLMLVAVLVTWFGGYKFYTVKHGLGTVVASASIPEVEQTLVVEPDLAEEEFWQSFHAVAAYVLLGLIAFHVVFVVWLSRVQRENLLKAMVTGVKKPQS